MNTLNGRWRGAAVIPAAVLACVPAACMSPAPPLAAGDSGRGSAHGSFSCRGPALRHHDAKAFVAGHTALTPVDLATGKAGRPLRTPADPVAIVISPDGRTAYAGTADSVIPIDVTTDAVGEPIATPAGAELLAITPDGRTAYAAGNGNSAGMTPVFLRTCTVGRVIATPGLTPIAIAIASGGQTAYLAGYLETDNGQSSQIQGLLRVDLARGIAGKFLPVPGIQDAAVAPDGRMAYVTVGRSVIPVSLPTGKLGPPIQLPGLGAGAIAITPSGRTAYVGILKPETPDAAVIVPVDLTAGTAGTPIHVPSYPFSVTDIAIAADGRTAYAANSAWVMPVHLATGKAGRRITVPDGAYFIAITP
jgi:DNA-binding beta-propeller fold protein YncE